jgi:hypothetical protein
MGSLAASLPRSGSSPSVRAGAEASAPASSVLRLPPSAPARVRPSHRLRCCSHCLALSRHGTALPARTAMSRALRAAACVAVRLASGRALPRVARARPEQGPARPAAWPLALPWARHPAARGLTRGDRSACHAAIGADLAIYSSAARAGAWGSETRKTVCALAFLGRPWGVLGASLGCPWGVPGEASRVLPWGGHRGASLGRPVGRARGRGVGRGVERRPTPEQTAPVARSASTVQRAAAEDHSARRRRWPKRMCRSMP